MRERRQGFTVSVQIANHGLIVTVQNGRQPLQGVRRQKIPTALIDETAAIPRYNLGRIENGIEAQASHAETIPQLRILQRFLLNAVHHRGRQGATVYVGAGAVDKTRQHDLTIGRQVERLR